MLIPSLILFFLFLRLNAFFSSSETAFIALNQLKFDYPENRGSREASLVTKRLGRADNLLATILGGNTLANTADASVATFLFAHEAVAIEEAMHLMQERHIDSIRIEVSSDHKESGYETHRKE